MVVGGALGAAAIWHRRRRRAQPELPAGPDPADELRAKLATSKAAAAEEPPREAPPESGRTADIGSQPPEPLTEFSTLDPETRRRTVHERARASIDELDAGT